MKAAAAIAVVVLVSRWLDRGNALGLALTLQLAVLVAAGWASGVLVQEVLIGEDATRLDGPVVRYLAEHRTAGLTTSVRTLTWLGSNAVLIPLVVAVGLAARRRTRSWATMATLALILGGAIALQDLIKLLVERPRPHVGQLVASATGYAYPSGHATQVVTVAATLALFATSAARSPSRKVIAWTTAALISLFVGFSRIYLGVHWPTDVLVGYILGAAWVALSVATIRRTPRAAAPAPGNSCFPAFWGRLAVLCTAARSQIVGGPGFPAGTSRPGPNQHWRDRAFRGLIATLSD